MRTDHSSGHLRVDRQSHPQTDAHLYTTPPSRTVDRMTDRCKNITFRASLRYAVGNKIGGIQRSYNFKKKNNWNNWMSIYPSAVVQKAGSAMEIVIADTFGTSGLCTCSIKIGLK